MKPWLAIIATGNATAVCPVADVIPMGMVAFAIVSLLLSGCGRAGDPATEPVCACNAETLGPKYSLDTPVDRIAADQRGKAILQRDLPGLLSNRSYILFDDMSLSQIATVSGGRLTEARLDAVQADLSQLPP